MSSIAILVFNKVNDSKSCHQLPFWCLCPL